MKRVGHGGASALVRANTLESFDTALEIGVDMIEFDVRAGGRGLVLAHTRLDLCRRGLVPLADALRHLSLPRFADVELNADVKSPGCEPALIEALERFGLGERTLVSSQCRSVIARMRELAPETRLGLSVGGRVSRVSQRWRSWREAVVEAMRARRFEVLMLHHSLIDPGLLERVAGHGGEVYAWTAHDRALVERLTASGVHGIAASDPRLFASL